MGVHGSVAKKKDEESFCFHFSKQGYITASMNYTLINPQENDASFILILSEIKHCIQKIKEETKKRKIHINRMALSGTSAGGHLALLYAYKCTEESCIPLAFVAQRVGPVDLTQIFNFSANLIDSIHLTRKSGKVHPKEKELTQLIHAITGQEKVAAQLTDKQTIDSLILLGSPIRYLNENSVPGVFAYGEKDMLIQLIHPTLLANAYDSLKLPYEMILFPNSDHLLLDDPDCAKQYIEKIESYAKEYFK